MAGDVHVCVRLEGDDVLCWGANSQGQLGDGGTVDAASPRLVLDAPILSQVPQERLPVIRSISASRKNTCVAKMDDRVYCWGDNGHGQLRNGVGNMSPTPLRVDLVGSV